MNAISPYARFSKIYGIILLFTGSRRRNLVENQRDFILVHRNKWVVVFKKNLAKNASGAVKVLLLFVCFVKYMLCPSSRFFQGDMSTFFGANKTCTSLRVTTRSTTKVPSCLHFLQGYFLTIFGWNTGSHIFLYAWLVRDLQKKEREVEVGSENYFSSILKF